MGQAGSGERPDLGGLAAAYFNCGRSINSSPFRSGLWPRGRIRYASSRRWSEVAGRRFPISARPNNSWRSRQRPSRTWNAPFQQEENAINILVGRNPGAQIDRGLEMAPQSASSEPPAGIPSALLERRPDIAEAEEILVAANARIGVARAAFFPDIELTGLGGAASVALTTMFRGASRAWSFTGSVMEPIFTKGRLDANLKLVEAQHEEALLRYQQTIQRAFQEVSDALIATRKFRESRAHGEKLLAAARDASSLARMRYQGGAASYLEVLTNETNAYSAEIGLSAAILNERLALVQLYNALGGGWTP